MADFSVFHQSSQDTLIGPLDNATQPEFLKGKEKKKTENNNCWQELTNSFALLMKVN